MSAAVAALLLLGALLVLLAPLLVAPGEDPCARARQREAEDAGRQEHLLSAIRDLDLDLAMGKLSPEDHAALRRSLEDEAIALLAEQEGSQARSPGDAA